MRTEDLLLQGLLATIGAGTAALAFAAVAIKRSRPLALRMIGALGTLSSLLLILILLYAATFPGVEVDTSEESISPGGAFIFLTFALTGVVALGFVMTASALIWGLGLKSKMYLPLRGEVLSQKVGLIFSAIPIGVLTLWFAWTLFGIAVPLLVALALAITAIQFHRSRRRSSQTGA